MEQPAYMASSPPWSWNQAAPKAQTAKAATLTAVITKPLSISTANAVTKVQEPATDTSYTVLIVPTTGMVTGVFTHEDDTKPAYKAVIYQKGTGAGAFGFFLSTKPTVIDYMGESGGVTLLAK